MSHRLYERIHNLVSEVSSQLDIFDKASLHKKKQKTSQSSSDQQKYRPISCNPNLRLYKYTKGQWFGRHIDDSNKIKITSDAPPAIASAQETHTEITVLFYLSSCRGGATRFYMPKGKGKKDDTIAFTPEEGAVLLHIHGDRCLEHEAEPVLDGIKYGELNLVPLFYLMTVFILNLLNKLNASAPHRHCLWNNISLTLNML